jgi:hypothetical protein
VVDCAQRAHGRMVEQTMTLRAAHPSKRTWRPKADG